MEFRNLSDSEREELYHLERELKNECTTHSYSMCYSKFEVTSPNIITMHLILEFGPRDPFPLHTTYHLNINLAEITKSYDDLPMSVNLESKFIDFMKKL